MKYFQAWSFHYFYRIYLLWSCIRSSEPKANGQRWKDGNFWQFVGTCLIFRWRLSRDFKTILHKESKRKNYYFFCQFTRTRHNSVFAHKPVLIGTGSCSHWAFLTWFGRSPCLILWLVLFFLLWLKYSYILSQKITSTYKAHLYTSSSCLLSFSEVVFFSSSTFRNSKKLAWGNTIIALWPKCLQDWVKTSEN